MPKTSEQYDHHGTIFREQPKNAPSGLSVSAKEVLAVLQSHRIPDIHPLREYVLNCPPHPYNAPDWIGWMAQQVKVEGGEARRKSMQIAG